jgi:hypothetical protein
MNRDCQGTIASMSIRASHKRPIRVRAWRSAMGQRLASSRRPLRWPLSRPAINVRMGTAPAKSVLFRRSLVAIRFRDNRLWGDPRCRCARGSDAPCGRKSGPNTLSVSAPAAASLPLAGQGHDDPRIRLPRRQTIREQDSEGTASSFSEVPPHAPRAVPTHWPVLPTTPACSAFALGRPSGRLTRGERRPCGRKRRPKPGRRLSNVGRRSPSLQAAVENEPARLHRVAGVRRTSAPCCATVTALAPIAIVRACSAASRFRALRAPRP